MKKSSSNHKKETIFSFDIAIAGSWISNEIYQCSNLDLVIITKDNLNVNKSKMLAYDQRFGNLFSAFTGEYVGKRRLLSCLYFITSPTHLIF